MKVKKRQQTPGEEIANSMSHGLGLVGALIAAPILITVSARTGTTANLVGAVVFALCMVLTYLNSSLYHLIPQGPLKQVFRKLDHAAIFLLIAGTYTPFTLGVLNGTLGWTLFGLVWGMAALGLVLMQLDRLSNPWVANGLYLAMGWLIVIATVPMVANMERAGLLLLLAGGLAYSGGVVFYALDARMRYGHFVWHLFVLAGSTCHFFAVLWYAG
ncbi:hemolysin III family protein [Niveibacterium sp. 24ML]|uniref:PAQR family membrane homeostasis protein TrhA n=1 Tax=Niveibacterium sp. 24ML TaxID=2985512 RepID=UPI0022722B69|nr:hemolysin III family protein [Niveibacterium sp. 24ML]MCX9155825.1 hemolysin III family protein [Niveibacterium sp. 24ML]